MIVFFNLENLTKEANNNHSKTLAILKDLATGRILKYGLKQRLRGHSFLIHPLKLIDDKSTDILYKIQYLKLASLRDYSMYSLFGIRSLQLSYYPDIRLDNIRTNPLLTITNTDIHFKYEE